MSMLAEPRRKQKWTLNPRGKQWSEDSSKFGQKMLEKMGWTNGKGLGANEQGMTEHVKVSYKNNQSGIGFQDKGDQWTQHQADFNDFLSQLQEQNSNSDVGGEIKETEKDESLELKSKQSRARVHYHKFTRGKDVKKYSSKDLANIFGKRDLKDAVEVSKGEKTAEDIPPEPTGSRDNRGGVLTIKGGNIDEYFKNKLPNFVKKRNSDEADDSEGEYEPRLGFGFSSVKDSDESEAPGKNKSPKKKGDTSGAISSFAFSNPGLDLDYQVKERDSENKNVQYAYDNPSLNIEKPKNGFITSAAPFSNEGFANPALNLNDSINNENNGAEFEVSRVEFGLDNNALDLSDENNIKKRVTFNEKVEYNTDIVKKKKKRKSSKGKLDKFEVDNSKLKKKSKEITSTIEFVPGNEAEGFVNEALEIEAISDEINDNELNERKTKKSKRKKNRRASILETIEETAEENSQIIESEIGEAVLLEETPTKRNKKLKKNPESELSLEINVEVSEMQSEEAPVTKKKDRKDKKIIQAEEIVPEKKSDKKKGKIKKIEEAEITVLGEISKKISKSKKNKIADEPQSSDTQQEAIESTEPKKKDKKRSKLKGEGKETVPVKSEETNERIDAMKSGAATKRKKSSGENSEKSTKRTKFEKDDRVAQENTENVEQNGDISLNSMLATPLDKKDKKSKKKFKSLFAKTPTLYFLGSNINEMAGYGAVVAEVRQ